MKKQDLKDGDIVILRNGDELIYVGEEFTDTSIDNSNNLCEIYDLSDNLKMKDRFCEESDIIKVKRPIDYEYIFDRDENVREMTVEEISKELGYEVKIVKE